jgi:hypothetical protein
MACSSCMATPCECQTVNLGPSTVHPKDVPRCPCCEDPLGERHTLLYDDGDLCEGCDIAESAYRQSGSSEQDK